MPELRQLAFDLVLPATFHLVLGGTHDEDKLAIMPSELKRVLGATSPDLLETLSINIDLHLDPTPDPEPYPKLDSLKELRIVTCPNNDPNFWMPFTTACSNAESLVIVDVAAGARALQASIAKHMKSLDRIQFGVRKQANEDVEYKPYDPDDDDGFSNDGNVACYISSGTKGWKCVQSFVQMAFGPEANDALKKHHATLEEFEVTGPVDGEYLLDALVGCPRLRKVEALHSHLSDYAPVDAELFAGWDKAAGSPKPWKSEATLQTLKVGIRIDKNWDQIQGLNSKVPVRLARMTNLEVLWLGRELDEDPYMFSDMDGDARSACGCRSSTG
ncbi:hypothetical protein BG000_011171 [Podila horticola]|nr:hypothetical protein BG000_011171 [Podila horticola]